MTIDLHVHSTASDGTDTPTAVVRKSASKGLRAIALTDHDTQLGVAEAQATADEVGVELVPGVELSLAYDDGGMHLVVLWLRPGPGPLQDRLEDLRIGRNHRNLEILDRLAQLNMPITLDELEAEAGDGSVGRPHIAAVMVAKSYVPDIRTAFDLWLGSQGPAYVPRARLDPEVAIDLAHQSGAVSVLSHPHTLGIRTADAMALLLGRLKEAGLVSLEAIYSSYRQHERDGYAALARRFGLVPSGGSDYHGTYKPGLEIGTGYSDLSIPDSVLDELRSHVG